MIPNFAPMAAIYHRPAATGSRDGKLFSRPVVGWDGSGRALVVLDGARSVLADEPYPDVMFLGLWQRGWLPSYDEMASFLPERTSGSPDPLGTSVVIQEGDDGWWRAHRCDDDKQVTTGRCLEEVEQRLSTLGSFHIDRIVPLHDY